jgi:hypothetical protein
MAEQCCEGELVGWGTGSDGVFEGSENGLE